MSEPVKKLMRNGVEIAVWQKEVQTKESKFIKYSLTIQQNYFDKQANEWKNTPSIDSSNVLVLREMLRQIDAWVEAQRIMERVKQKQS